MQDFAPGPFFGPPVLIQPCWLNRANHPPTRPPNPPTQQCWPLATEIVPEVAVEKPPPPIPINHYLQALPAYVVSIFMFNPSVGN